MRGSDTKSKADMDPTGLWRGLDRPSKEHYGFMAAGNQTVGRMDPWLYRVDDWDAAKLAHMVRAAHRRSEG